MVRFVPGRDEIMGGILSSGLDFSFVLRVEWGFLWNFPCRIAYWGSGRLQDISRNGVPGMEGV